jgi:hypothetical protein
MFDHENLFALQAGAVGAVVFLLWQVARNVEKSLLELKGIKNLLRHGLYREYEFGGDASELGEIRQLLNSVANILEDGLHTKGQLGRGYPLVAVTGREICEHLGILARAVEKQLRPNDS